MFTWLNKQGVASDDQYTLQRMHRFFYHYQEGDYVLQVNVEPSSDCEEIFFSQHPQWNPPHHLVPIEQKKLKQIQQNIDAALSFMGIPHTFQ